MSIVKNFFAGLWPLKIAVFLLLLNGLVTNDHIPNGVFTAKELFLYFSGSASLIFAILKLTFDKRIAFSCQLIDLFVFVLLVVLPICHLLFLELISTSAIANQTGLGIAYLSIRILSQGFKPLALTSALSNILITVSILHLIITFAQFYDYLPSYYPEMGVTGMFSNPGPFAIYTSILSAFLFGLLLESLRSNFKYKAFFISVILFFNIQFILESSSRSAWISLASAMVAISIVFFLEWYGKQRFFNLKYVKPVSLVVVLLSILLTLNWLYHLRVESANGRILIWKATLLMIKDNLIAGVGLGNFPPNYIRYQSQFLIKNQSDANIYGHLAGDSHYSFNDLLQLSAEIGIAGTVIFLIILFFMVQSSKKLHIQKNNHNDYFLVAVGMVGMLIVILISGQTSYPLQQLPMAIIFWVMISLVTSISPLKTYYVKAAAKKVVILSLLPLFVFQLSYGICQIQGYFKWVGLMGLEKREQQAGLAKLYANFNTNPQYLLILGELYMNDKAYHKALPLFERGVKLSPFSGFYYNMATCFEVTGRHREAEKVYKFYDTAVPTLIKPKYCLSILYYREGDITRFIESAHATIAFIPKIENEEIESMKRDLRKLLEGVQKSKTDAK